MAGLFTPTSTKNILSQVSTSTLATTSPEALAIPNQKIKVWKVADSIFAEWTGNPSDTPLYFCGQSKTTCQTKILVYKTPHLKTVDFYPGRNDVIVFSTDTGIYVTELDLRSTQNVATMLSGSSLDFRVSDGEQVFIKSKKGYFQAAI